MYYRIDWDALNSLPDNERMAALADIFERVRHAVGAERGRIAHQAYAEHGTKKAAAEALGMKPARFGQIYQEYEMSLTDYQMSLKDTEVTRVAYDFGDELHIMDIDAQGVYVDGTVEVLPNDGGRDQILEAAGYRTAGQWQMQGEAEGITVERA